MSEYRKTLLKYCSDESLTAVILPDAGGCLSYRELFGKALTLADYLEARGVASGDRVAINLESRIDFVVAYLANFFFAFVAVPINKSAAPGDFEFICDVVQPALVLSQLPELSVASYEEIEKRLLKRSESDLAYIFFTSGTTSRPKGVCHSLGSFLKNADDFCAHVSMTSEVRMLHVMPIGYVAGLLNTVLCPLLRGGTILLAPQFSAFSAESILRHGRENEANALWLSPTMAAFFSRLKPDAATLSWCQQYLRSVFVGTAPLSLAQKERFEKTYGVLCLESFGMSEILLAAGNQPGASYKLFSVGRILEAIEVEARDENGQKLPRDREGILHIRARSRMLGYWDFDSRNAVWSENSEWLNSGDVGIVDEDNYLFITGRAKDLIIKGGVNVSPRAIEEVLMRHPAVDEVAVVGREHPFWGEEIVAFVILKEKVALSVLAEFSRENLSVDMVPSEFIQREAFPRTSTGKVQKAKLRKELLDSKV